MSRDYTVEKYNDELLIRLEEYELCVFNVEPLFDVDAQSRIIDDHEGYAVPPSTFTLRIYNHPIQKGDLEFCWDGIWLINLSQGWKMHLGPDNGGLIPLGGKPEPVIH